MLTRITFVSSIVAALVLIGKYGSEGVANWGDAGYQIVDAGWMFGRCWNEVEDRLIRETNLQIVDLEVGLNAAKSDVVHVRGQAFPRVDVEVDLAVLKAAQASQIGRAGRRSKVERLFTKYAAQSPSDANASPSGWHDSAGFKELNERVEQQGHQLSEIGGRITKLFAMSETQSEALGKVHACQDSHAEKLARMEQGLAARNAPASHTIGAAAAVPVRRRGVFCGR